MDAPLALLTPEEAAAYLRVSKRQIYAMTRRRGLLRMAQPIPVIRLNGNLRFRKESLDAWILRCEQQSGTQPAR